MAGNISVQLSIRARMKGTVFEFHHQDAKQDDKIESTHEKVWNEFHNNNNKLNISVYNPKT